MYRQCIKSVSEEECKGRVDATCCDLFGSGDYIFVPGPFMVGGDYGRFL